MGAIARTSPRLPTVHAPPFSHGRSPVATAPRPGAVTVGPEGLARLAEAPGGDGFRATLDDEVTADIPEVVAKGRTALIERVLGDATGGGGLTVLAPHGGMVEAGTDRQAERAHAAVAAAGRSARGWLCQGWKRGGGAKLCWHVTSAEISGRSFPKLGALLAAKADHAVAFHGWTADRIGVCGGAVDRAAHPERHHGHEALKEKIRARIRAALDALGPPWSGLPVVLEISGGFSGEGRAGPRRRRPGRRRRLPPAKGRVARNPAGSPPLSRRRPRRALTGLLADDRMQAPWLGVDPVEVALERPRAPRLGAAVSLQTAEPLTTPRRSTSSEKRRRRTVRGCAST